MNGLPPEGLDEYRARREIWERKPQIRLVYRRWVERYLRPWLPPGGPWVEVGSGSGLLGELLPGVQLTDVVELPWIDRVADAEALPFEDEELGALIALDMLHHLPDPHAFLRQAARCLRPGGRVLLIEPWISPLSGLGYRLLHHEDVYLGDYHRSKSGGLGADPWEGNLGLPNLVFGRDLADWSRLHPRLRIVERHRFSLLDFQLAAGFKPRALLPHPIFRRLVRLDDWLGPLLPLVAFRIFVVLEKSLWERRVPTRHPPRLNGRNPSNSITTVPQ